MIKYSYIKFFIFILASCYLIGQTNSDLKNAIKAAKSAGLSNDQIIETAKKRGITDAQINQKKTELSKNARNANQIEANIEEVSPLNTNESSNQVDFLEEGNNSQELDIVETDDLKIENRSQDGKAGLRYFGYDIFARDPSIFQDAQIGAVDPNYVISPGDEIIVMLWGETQFRQVLSVNREGFIFIPDIGQVFVNGLNLDLLESKLFKVLSQSFASLSPLSGEATTFLDVSLGEIRPLRIQVLGEVRQPGAYTVSPSTTLFTSLYYFNGPSTLGSLRDIRLIRNGKEISSIDFYDYLMTGKQPDDIKLQLDDVIFIPKRKKSISINGGVNRSGIYELKEDETLRDLIDIAGGLLVTAYLDRAQIDRIVPMNQRESFGMDRMLVDIDLRKILVKSSEDFELSDGDYISIYSIMDARQNIAQISGAVSRPGKYELVESMRVRDLILKADSLLGDAYLDRADITRVKSNFDLELIKLNLKEVMRNNLNENILLNSLDQVRVYSKTDMIDLSYVVIDGHVKNPGRYLLKENMTLYDIIFIAGGHVDEEFIKGTYLERAELIRENPRTRQKEVIPFNMGDILEKSGLHNIILNANDRIIVYSSDDIEGPGRFVSITGSVKSPGRYELFEDNMTAYDLIFKAGGLVDEIFKSRTYLERADLVRLSDDQLTSTVESFNLGKVLEDKNSSENFTLKPGDLIRIYSKDVFNFFRHVTINGTIRNPAQYPYKKGMKIKDLVLEAGGVSEDVFRYRVEIARIDPDIVSEEVFAESFIINIDNDFNPISSSDDIPLMPYDYIVVRPDPFFEMQRLVAVEGAVKYPGEYAILSASENIYDIINRAGGFTLNHYGQSSQFFRDGKIVQVDIGKILKKPKLKTNIILNNGDRIFVPEKKNIFEIQGEVATPGFYTYGKDSKFKVSIKHSGGFTQNVDKKNIYISYPDGRTKRIKYFFQNPKLADGCIVFIGRKEEEEPFDSTEFAKEFASILSDFAQVISILLIASR